MTGIRNVSKVMGCFNDFIPSSEINSMNEVLEELITDRLVKKFHTVDNHFYKNLSLDPC